MCETHVTMCCPAAFEALGNPLVTSTSTVSNWQQFQPGSLCWVSRTGAIHSDVNLCYNKKMTVWKRQTKTQRELEKERERERERERGSERERGEVREDRDREWKSLWERQRQERLCVREIERHSECWMWHAWVICRFSCQVVLRIPRSPESTPYVYPCAADQKTCCHGHPTLDAVVVACCSVQWKIDEPISLLQGTCTKQLKLLSIFDHILSDISSVPFKVLNNINISATHGGFAPVSSLCKLSLNDPYLVQTKGKRCVWRRRNYQTAGFGTGQKGPASLRNIDSLCCPLFTNRHAFKPEHKTVHK